MRFCSFLRRDCLTFFKGKIQLRVISLQGFKNIDTTFNFRKYTVAAFCSLSSESVNDDSSESLKSTACLVAKQNQAKNCHTIGEWEPER